MRRILKKIFRKLHLIDEKNSARKNVEIVPIQPHLNLIVYWKVLQVGKGPALILEAYGKEILKFDCFGKKDGHYHVAPNYGKRISFDEQTAIKQIDRTAIELKENAQFYLGKQEDERIKHLKIDQTKMATASDYAKQKMIFFLQNVSELDELI